MQWRTVLVLGLVAAAAAPARAQVDSTRPARRPRAQVRDEAGRSYSISTNTEGWLGVGLQCSNCRFQAEGKERNWTFSEPPRVFSVDDGGPGDEAGLRIGDVLVAVNGVSLTTSQGGTRFGSIKPGQSVRLTYRREGRDRTVTMVAARRPADSRQMEDVSRALRRAQEEQQRTLESSSQQLERSRDQLDRLRSIMQEQLDQAQTERDSTSVAQLARLRAVLEAQERVLERSLAERSTLEGRMWNNLEPALAPTPMPAQPAMPAMPAEPAEPAETPEPALVPAPPMPYREHRGFGPLRYTGRLGDVVIEARGPGGVTATEVSDREVVITSGDLSVRLALRPADTPKAAPTPRPPRD